MRKKSYDWNEKNMPLNMHLLLQCTDDIRLWSVWWQIVLAQLCLDSEKMFVNWYKLNQKIV